MFSSEGVCCVSGRQAAHPGFHARCGHGGVQPCAAREPPPHVGHRGADLPAAVEGAHRVRRHAARHRPQHATLPADSLAGTTLHYYILFHPIADAAETRHGLTQIPNYNNIHPIGIPEPPYKA